jgi:HSP20 family protein
MDVLDNSQNPKIVAALELPGLKKEEISLRIQDGSLVVWGERRSRLAPEGSVAAETHPTQEFRYGKFRRVIPLPKGSQTSEISASMAEGVLTITWPREPVASIVQAA